MLIALITSLFLSGGGIPGQDFLDMLHAVVKENVTETDRKNALESNMDNLEEELKGYSKKLKKSVKVIKKLNRDHASVRRDFEKVLNELNDQRTISQERVLDLRFKMKERMTREEWQSVFNPRE